MHTANEIWAQAVPEFHEALETADDQKSVLNTTTRLLDQMGFDYMAYARITPCTPENSAEFQPETTFINYPDAWVEQYTAEKLDTCDPVVQRSKSIGRPFRWKEVSKNAKRMTKCETRVFNCAEDAGLKDGVTVPLVYPSRQFGLVSFASCDQSEKAPEAYVALHLVASMMHANCLDKVKSESLGTDAPSLTPRERECLRWIAEGKSSWDIGQILCISECTVNYHVQKLLRKFSTSSRTVAVCIALRHGLI